MKFRLSIIAVLLLCAAGMRAQDGSTAYNFLNVSSSAKVYGLGGVNISLVDDDITVIDQNPALLGPEMSNMVALNYMRYIGGSNFAGLRYGHSAGEHGAWAAHIQYFGYGSMKETLPEVAHFQPCAEGETRYEAACVGAHVGTRLIVVAQRYVVVRACYEV